MKCTNKKMKKRVSRKQRKKKLLTMILLGMCVLILLAAGVLLVLSKKKESPLYAPMPFVLAEEINELSLKDDFLIADGVAADLCVGADNTPYSGIQTQDDEKAALFDISRKNLMFSRSLYEKAYPASITKIMTALIAMEKADMDEIVTIVPEDVQLEEGSQVAGLVPGDRVSMDKLFHALLVYSANDAAMAIARTVGGDIDTFVQMMNEEAQRLGMTGTHFMNPHGLHNENHYTTVYDIYLMLNEAMKNPVFTDTTQLGSYTLEYEGADGEKKQRWLDATDHYLTGESAAPKGITILGGKTGTTDDAGACLALMVQNNYGEPYISIVLDAYNKTILYDRMNMLLEKTNRQ